ncbi:ShET2/EspL2 family type III secretion system effector toxin [Ideonella sp. YS5]|uniref:ShET2/EspL2 family type III secretion system effector toxin n=1 Tax=Ideonella sp. YS5 TaxID=3453714 RepID=UPI003EEECA8F
MDSPLSPHSSALSSPRPASPAAPGRQSPRADSPPPVSLVRPDGLAPRGAASSSAPAPRRLPGDTPLLDALHRLDLPMAQALYEREAAGRTPVQVWRSAAEGRRHDLLLAVLVLHRRQGMERQLWETPRPGSANGELYRVLDPRLGVALAQEVKQLPYYSEKPHRSTDLNLNDEWPLPDDASEKICCRHLALTWVLQVMATGKPDYTMLGDAEVLQRELPHGLEAMYDRLLNAAPEVQLVGLADWGPFAAAQLQGLAAAPGPSSKSMLVLSGDHVMALHLKVKPGPDGEPRFVANFYEPNRTATHKRTASSSLQRFEALRAQDLFIDAPALEEFFGEETDAMFITLPAGGPDSLQAPPPGGDPQRRLAGPLPPLRPSVMHHIGLGGFAGTLRDLAPAFTDLARRDPAGAFEFLDGRSNEGVPALHLALQDNHAHVISEFARLLEVADLDEDDHFDLLAACDDADTSGLFMAMQGGQAEAVRAFIDSVAASGLPPSRQFTLLTGLAPPSDLGLVIALRPQGLPALQPFLDGLAAHRGLTLEDRMRLIDLPGREGRPALGHAVLRSQPQAVTTLVAWITSQGFAADDQCELLMAYDDEDTPALTRAMERNASENIAAFVDAVLASSLEETDKVHVLTAGGTPGSLLNHARSHGSEDAIAAFRASILRSSLPPSVQELLLKESSSRRRLR